jgi:hypothetical protein
MRWRGIVVLRGERGVFARAGDAGVELRVLAIATSAAKVVDDLSGYAVIDAEVSFFGDERFCYMSQDPNSSSADFIVANGQLLRIGASTEGQSVHARVLVFRQYPIPDRVECRVQVRAEGYAFQELKLPVHVVGTAPDAASPTIVRLSRIGNSRSGLVLKLQDSAGVPVRDTHVHLVFRPHGMAPVQFARRVWFDRRGVTEIMALDPGTYDIRAAALEGREPIVPTTVEVTPGTVASATMRLGEWAGLELVVTDANGVALADYGVEIGLGQFQPPRVEHREGGVIIHKRSIHPPGLGTGLAQLYRLDAGDYVVRVTHHGYRPVTVNATCVAGTFREVHVAMEANSANWRPEER